MTKATTSAQRGAKRSEALAALRAQTEERLAQCLRLMESGVRIVDPATTYVEPTVTVGEGTVIHPNTTIAGDSAIGGRCRIGPNTVITDCRIEDDVAVVASMLEGAVLGAGTDVGPFSHLRPGTHLEADVHIGNFVEIKASRLGRGTKVGHFTYLGDAQVEAQVNIGAGTVTCNYDGEKKSETVIEEGAFIGSDTMLVAPVRVGRNASTGAGSVVTHDVPAGTQVVGVPARRAARMRSQRQVLKQLG